MAKIRSFNPKLLIPAQPTETSCWSFPQNWEGQTDEVKKKKRSRHWIKCEEEAQGWLPAFQYSWTLVCECACKACVILFVHEDLVTPLTASQQQQVKKTCEKTASVKRLQVSKSNASTPQKTISFIYTYKNQNLMCDITCVWPKARVTGGQDFQMFPIILQPWDLPGHPKSYFVASQNQGGRSNADLFIGHMIPLLP